jgi:hypothetical protein
MLLFPGPERSVGHKQTYNLTLFFSVYDLSKWVDKGLMKAAPLWMFSDVSSTAFDYLYSKKGRNLLE